MKTYYLGRRYLGEFDSRKSAHEYAQRVCYATAEICNVRTSEELKLRDDEDARRSEEPDYEEYDNPLRENPIRG